MSVSPSLHWRFRLSFVALKASCAVTEAFRPRAIHLVTEPKMESIRWARAAAKAYLPISLIELASAILYISCRRFLEEIETMTSAEGAERIAETDQIMAPPMAPLPNLRQEAFAQRVAAGYSATAAYASAYGRPRDVSCRVSGRRLLTKDNIRNRIARIQSEAAWFSLPTIRTVIEEAERSTIKRIRRGSFKQACQATEHFAKLVIKLNSALSRKS